VTRTTLFKITAAITLALSLGACASDDMQRTDSNAYSHGDAVKANMAIQTINPSKASMYKKSGLGKNGAVIASSSAAAAPTP
jgi:hypothetical protein